jgi:class 3 adenylate cyclase
LSRRKNQARTLSCLLIAFSVGFWMLEKYTAATFSPKLENATQVGDIPGNIHDEDLVFIWGQYVLLCLPICLLLGFMFSKSYKRAPGLLTAIACIASGTAFAAVIELNQGVPRGQTVAMLWLTAVTHGYFGGYMSPAVALLTNSANSGMMIATLQSCSMVQPEWMCTHLWTVLLLSIPVHVSGISAGIIYDRSRRLRYAWWEYYATVAREFQDNEDCDHGNLSRSTTNHLSKSGQLLSLLVPPHVAARALAEGSAVTEDYGSAILAAVDIAGFSQVAQQHDDADSGKIEALAFVRDAFSVAEILAQKYQVRLLRRAGTSLLVGTGPLSRCQSEGASEQHVEGVAEAERLALFGLELIENVRVWCVERWGSQLYQELEAGVRVGISTGRASAGLIGSMRFGYDVWSSGALLANRLESHAALNTCCTSAEIRASLRRASTAYRFDDQSSRPMMVQGLGSLRTFTLTEYVPAAAEGARLSLSVATPSGIEFGLTPTPARDEDEMIPTTLETLEPVDNMRGGNFSESETGSESESTDDDHGETMPASHVSVITARSVQQNDSAHAHEQLMPRPVPPPHEPPRFARGRQQSKSPHPVVPMPPAAGGPTGAGAAQAQARPQRRVVIG